jgi:opacity protein-like surface antigen
MKRSLIILLNIIVLSVYGRDLPVKTFEFEPFLGATYGLSSQAGHRDIGQASGMEGRWNIRKYPFDTGIQLYLGSAETYYKRVEYISCRTLSFTVIGDYNWKLGSSFSPFAGLGLGLNYYDMIGSELYQHYNDTDTDVLGLGLVPRVGIEFFRHIRITLTGHLGKKTHNTVGLALGYAFGGGKRK